MEDFSISVAKWVEKAKANADAVFQGIATEALARVKELTPVNTGYLKASWTASVEGAPMVDADNNSAASIAQAHIGEKIIISNPVVYAARIEFGFNGKDKLGRVYHEKGHAMMQQTIAEIPEIAERVLQKLKS